MKRRILFILHLPPPVHGAAMMGKYIQESEIINSTFVTHYINLTTAKSLQDIGKGGIKKLWRYICLLLHIIRKVLALQPDMVYITPNACGGAFYKDFIVVQLLKLLNQKVVLHYHNKGVKTRENKKLDHWLYTHFFKKVKVILLAEILYSDIQKYVDKKNVYICPNGIPEKETILQREEKEGTNFLFLSNLLFNKGVITLLEALQHLKQNGYAFTCDLIGGVTNEISQSQLAEEIRKRELQKSVIYHGPKYGEEKEKYLVTGDCLIFPTQFETFGLVLLEAMEYQLPCISTFEGGIPEIISNGQTGWLVPKNSSKELAEKMAWMIDHPEEAREMGRKGRERFLEKFTLEHFETNLKEILQAALSD